MSDIPRISIVVPHLIDAVDVARIGGECTVETNVECGLYGVEHGVGRQQIEGANITHGRADVETLGMRGFSSAEHIPDTAPCHPNRS